jgi:sec-independent protein translocase protein TatA
MRSMIASTFGPTEMGIVLVIVLVLFGGSQLPKLAKNLGKAQKEFKDGLSEGQKEAAKEAAKSSDSTKSDDT